MVESKDGRRPSGFALWRGRHRQISTDGGAVGAARYRATYELALFLLAAAYRQRILSDSWPDGTCCQICARRHAKSEARQARCVAGANLDLQAGSRALCRYAVGGERWTLPRA